MKYIKLVDMERLYWNYDVWHTQDISYVIQLLIDVIE